MSKIKKILKIFTRKNKKSLNNIDDLIGKLCIVDMQTGRKIGSIISINHGLISFDRSSQNKRIFFPVSSVKEIILISDLKNSKIEDNMELVNS